jgi:hypothetical protein
MSAFGIEWTYLPITYGNGCLEGFARPRGLSRQHIKDAGGNLQQFYCPPGHDVAAFSRSQGLRFLLKHAREFLEGQCLLRIMERARPPP